ncbi:MAG: hypothetical protein JWM91_5084 [Rhodospirillales bacterium]|nr:hypothetical protein [Rhodospirillales bacterium]
MLSNQQPRSIAATLKRRLLEAPKATQRRYVRGLVSNIVVNRELAVITGPRAALASYASNPDRIPAVPGLVREWRANLENGRCEHAQLKMLLHNQPRMPLGRGTNPYPLYCSER